MITQEFDLNLIPTSAPVVVHVDQYDHGTGRLIANLYEGDAPYAPNGAAIIQGTKPDGHGFVYNATIEGNVVTADLTEQMAAVAGDVRTQIVVTESTGRTGTFVFILKVQKSALPDDTDMSESDYQLIEEAIEEVQEAITEAQDYSYDSEAWAKGTRNGTAVGPGDPTYGQNSKSFAQMAEIFKKNSEAWAVGTNNGVPIPSTGWPQYNNHAKYWAEKSQEYAIGALHFKLSIPFADIPTTGMAVGDMYNITDSFTTDSRFEEGAGKPVPAGANIAWTPNDKWDLLSSAVSGGGVLSFNGRTGAVTPTRGDYDASQITYAGINGIGTYEMDALNRGGGIWTTAVSCLVGDTSASITHGIANLALHPENYAITPYGGTASGTPIGFKKIEVVGSQVQITFTSALTEAASIKLHITTV